MPGLILEGGTIRPVFSAGAMDALLTHGLMFDYVIGVSAGITNAVSYISRQSGRNLEVLRRYRNDPRYLSPQNYIKDGSLFGLDFIYREIPERLLPFDWDTYYAFDGRIRVGVTNARTGAAEYLDGKTLAPGSTLLRATCALPFYFPEIRLGGTPYYDGGLADPIPIRRALADGSRRNLIILTQPESYRKHGGQHTALAAKALSVRYPHLARTMRHRPKHYNDTVCFVRQLEARRSQDTVVLRPETAINSFESEVSKIEAAYRAGYDLCESRISEIKNLF